MDVLCWHAPGEKKRERHNSTHWVSPCWWGTQQRKILHKVKLKCLEYINLHFTCVIVPMQTVGKRAKPIWNGATEPSHCEAVGLTTELLINSASRVESTPVFAINVTPFIHPDSDNRINTWDPWADPCWVAVPQLVKWVAKWRSKSWHFKSSGLQLSACLKCPWARH